MSSPWPWWMIFPVLAVLILPGLVAGLVFIRNEKRAWRKRQDETLKFCPRCDEWMRADECEGDTKYCERI